MKVLVIGGTQFIGRHVVTQLLAQNHDVTLFNRGKTGPEVFPQLNRILGDREQDDLLQISELRQNWDAVIDLCAYFPKSLLRLLETLKGRSGLYVQCSTISVYKSSININPSRILSENSELFECTESEAVDASMMTYGPRKAECERVARSQQYEGIPTVIIRPSVVYGEHDHTDRFAYWIWRATRNRKFILPEAGLTTVQKTYAPDLAQAFVSALTRPQAVGHAFNVADLFPLSLGSSLGIIGETAGVNSLANAISVSAEELQRLGVGPWSDLPLWIPSTNFLVDTYLARHYLEFVSTPPEIALKDATEAFLRLKRTPKIGLSEEAETRLIEKLSPNLNAKFHPD
ncbi:MAG: NAD-dependent epimerase/dehydratase family protein [Deltaproteobacteria bacterium]|jgi:2'-hydroxyisoflavone reductase|nr:NAD-dependent epimerase/dehydratase family protein [Deltaproteobacteria bacterium]